MLGVGGVIGQAAWTVLLFGMISWCAKDALLDRRRRELVWWARRFPSGD